jgi:hypothetical protein
MPMATKEAQREYQRLWMAARRAEWFMEKWCVQCGSIDDLELDHIDPVKKVSHNVWSWTKARQEVELAKCQVLCHDCHKIKTIEFLTEVYDHGDRKMYAYRGCRCSLCREGQRKYQQIFRAGLRITG